MTTNCEILVLEAEELDCVCGGNFFDGKVRTNGDDPFVRTVQLAQREAFYKCSFYQDQGWPC